MRIQYLLPALSLLVTVAIRPPTGFGAAPEDAADAVHAYVDNQTFLIGRLNVPDLPIDALQQRASALLGELIDDPNFRQGLEAGAKQITGLRDAFVQAGGKEVYLVVSMSDVPHQPPFFVVTSSSPDKLSVLEGLVSQLSGAARPQMVVRRARDNRLLVGTTETLDRIEALKLSPRAEVVAAFAAAGAAPIQMALAPSSDHHRVLEETFPQFPRPWEKLSGQTISDGIQWAALSLNVTPTFKAELLVESKDEAAAQQLRELAVSSLAQLAEHPAVKNILPDAKALFALIQPEVAGKQMHVTLTEDAKTMEAVMKPLTAAVTSARASAQRAQSMNNLKQLALGMHIYHDKHKQFPAAASCDANGKPLLSWRVHLLPYLDQQALYDQFKLDEPWDSEHNKKLALTIPKTLLDPSVTLKPGMTTYVVPVGEGTIFGGKEAQRIQDIHDGSSNTLMIVTTTPENAVIWTKPDDLPVTQADPKKGLFSEHRRMFLGAMADGSVRAFTDAIDANTLWLLFNANDRQVIDWEKAR